VSAAVQRVAIAVVDLSVSKGSPRLLNSSPVEKNATRKRRCTRTRQYRARPAHQLGRQQLFSRLQYRRTHGHIFAGLAHVSPAYARLTMIHSPSTCTTSCMSTVSAPSGMAAPVIMRTVSPALSCRRTARPPWRDRSRVGVSRRCPADRHRAARSHPLPIGIRRHVMVEITGAARMRPSAVRIAVVRCR